MQLSLNFIFLALIASVVQGAPVFLKKRIAQDISASTAKWEQACNAAGGGLQCNPTSVAAFSTLLAAPGPCEQQDAADDMIEFAKQLNDDAEMIRLTQIFVQQPRNSPSSESVQYCQKAPKNDELNGLFQCQFEGTNPTTFVGGMAVGQAGTIPFGMTSPLSPPGSCPAHPNGGIADGAQLVDTVSDPGTGTTGSGTATQPAFTTSAAVSSTTTTSSTGSISSTTGSTDSSAGGFQLQNGKDAQALNGKFATLTADSACSVGDQACVNGGFAQCVSGKFVIDSCGGDLACFAVPLVNSAGTSITCDTEDDAIARIAATGATGGLTGNGDVSGTTDSQTQAAAATTASAVAAATSSASARNDFHVQNGLDAQVLNAKFATLNADSACSIGDQACIDGGFAQCVDGKFVVDSCGETTCFALPLVNSSGTTFACTTEDDAIARFAASGVTGGITGNGADANTNNAHATTNTKTTKTKKTKTRVAAAPASTKAAAAATATSSSSATGDFKLQNGKDAQALNAKFETLSANSACTTGDLACINGAFAQCANGKFVVTSCSASLTCAALPLVNSAGTSIACTTEADALTRIAATGATGGLTGA
ncbi:hypothetical protein H0H87_003520 [Tephrocybe sp. NHM501043]|nr:hypothetical protein H0H87_003520 [Tephrocybe sp. NHM501043]